MSQVSIAWLIDCLVVIKAVFGLLSLVFFVLSINLVVRGYKDHIENNLTRFERIKGCFGRTMSVAFMCLVINMAIPCEGLLCKIFEPYQTLGNIKGE